MEIKIYPLEWHHNPRIPHLESIVNFWHNFVFAWYPIFALPPTALSDTWRTSQTIEKTENDTVESTTIMKIQTNKKMTLLRLNRLWAHSMRVELLEGGSLKPFHCSLTAIAAMLNDHSGTLCTNVLQVTGVKPVTSVSQQLLPTTKLGRTL